MKRVLLLYFSQTGQTRAMADAFAGPLKTAEGVALSVRELRPATPDPFPWPFWRFLETLPRSVLERREKLEPIDLDDADGFDLVVIAYPVWFLSPAPAVTSFLQSDRAAALLSGTQVITLITCRNMWTAAQERMKTLLARLNARLVDNVVLTDSGNTALTFVTTPIWLITGRRASTHGGLAPRAGVREGDIAACARFGEAVARALPARSRDDTSPMLSELGAVKVKAAFIAAERVGRFCFRLSSLPVREAPARPSAARRGYSLLQLTMIVALIMVVLPTLAIGHVVFAAAAPARAAALRRRYAAPSGE